MVRFIFVYLFVSPLSPPLTPPVPHPSFPFPLHVSDKPPFLGWVVYITYARDMAELTAGYHNNRNRNTGSGSRWQIGGAFAVDAGGFVRWSRPAASADDVPDFGEALRALGGHWGMAP